LGNNSDLEAEREVLISKEEELARKLGLEDCFCEVSAKTGENIDEAIHNFVRQIRRCRAQTWIQWLLKWIFWGFE
jgi:hypothetical protein